MSARVEVDPALLARAAGRLAALADEPVGRWDRAAFGSARVRSAAEGVDETGGVVAEVRRRRVWWRGAAVGVAVSMLVGGCVGRDEEPVLVTAQEKDELGYERPELWRNSQLQALVVENREQIYSVVQPYVERELGVRVEMTGLSATYPSSTIDVGRQTVDEPIVGAAKYVGIQPDGTVRSFPAGTMCDDR